MRTRLLFAPNTIALSLVLLASKCPGPGDAIARTPVELEIVPRVVMLTPGDTQRFHATAKFADGDSGVVTVAYAAGNGFITDEGLYTAGDDATYDLVISTEPATGVADTALVSILRAPVSSVELTPAAVELPGRGLWVATAVLRDEQGRVLTNRVITWESSDPSVVSIDGAGLVIGMEQGVATVSATSEGVTGAAQVTVTPEQAREWPNEPIDFVPIEDQPWSALDVSRWVLQWGVAGIAVDFQARLSPPLALELSYPPGFGGGEAPATMMIEFPGKRALYVGLWWKPSNPWQGHPSNVNKIQFLFAEDGSATYMAMYGRPGGPYVLRILPQFRGLPTQWYTPNVADLPIALGEWHRIEWLVVYNTTTHPPNGIYRWWLDGQLVGSHSDVPFPSVPLRYFKISPTWGGIGDVKTEADYFRYDHVYLSGR